MSHEFESYLAIAMIEKAIDNAAIRNLIAKVTHKLHTIIMLPLKEKCLNKGLEELSPALQSCFRSYSIQHSEEDKAIGALLPSDKQITLKHTLIGRQSLLNFMEEALLHPEDFMINIEGFISLIKVIDGMAYAHDNGAYNNQQRSENFEMIKSAIMPSKDEEDIRTPRAPMHLATTYGILTKTDEDIVIADEHTKGAFSGKARFIIFSAQERFTSLLNQFDNEEEPDKKNKLRDKLAFYNIPEEKSARRSIEYYAQRYKTSFEKLGTQNNKSVPLVAGPSFSMAKMFCMVYDLGLLVNDDVVNTDEAQILFNCFMSYYILCGHHSFFETHEMYMRFIDLLAIETQNGNAFMSILLTITQSTVPYFIDPNAFERKLPYGEIGNYKSCLHPPYAEEVIALAEEYQIQKRPLKFDDENTSLSCIQYDYR